MTTYMSKAYDIEIKVHSKIIIICLILGLGPRRLIPFLLVGLVGMALNLLLKHESIVIPPPRLPNLPKVESKPTSNALEFESFLTSYPDISRELKIIVNNIVRDFVSVWYESVSTNPAFPNAVKKVLFEVIDNVHRRITEIELAELLVLKLLPLVTKHFSNFAIAYETASSDAILQVHNKDIKNFDLAVAVEFNKSYKIHQALSGDYKSSTKDIQEYLSEKTKLIISGLLNGKELSSPYVRVLCREIVSNCILHPLTMTLSSSDFWNVKLIAISKKVLKERTQVQELRKALSREIEVPHTSEPTVEGTGSDKHSVRCLTSEANGQEFEYYLKYLSGLNNQLELCSEKFFILAKLLTLSKSSNLSTTSIEFRKRLQLALNLLESRLAYMTGTSKQISDELLETRLCEFEAFVKSVSLLTVLSDPSYTQCFHDFLLSCYSHQGTLEFWSFVEGVKIPLEDPKSEDMALDLSENGICDLQTAYSRFLKDEKTTHSFSEEYINDITKFLHTYKDVDRITSAQLYLRARKSLLLLQEEAYKKLQSIYFPKFKESLAFLKMISSPNFMRSSIYASYIHNIGIPSATRPVGAQLDTVGIIAIGDIDKALDDILNEDPKTPSKKELRKKVSYSNLFGKKTRGNIFDDSLFLDDAANHEYESEDEESSEHSDNTELDTSQDLLRSDIIDGDIMDSRIELKDIKEEIGKLIISIDKLQKQLELLKHLILKAELTNNQSQLKLLRKSERTLSNELEYKELLKQQYTVLENTNSLFGKTKISIKSYLSNISAEDGKEVTYYIVNVNHFNGNQVTSWEIPRRYSEFYKLHVYLRKTYGTVVNHLQKKNVFPQKVKMSLKFHVSKSLLFEERRYKLENYLRALLGITEVCQDSTFRRFLTDTSNSFSTDDLDIEMKKSPLSDTSLTQAAESNSVVKRCSGVEYLVTTLPSDDLSKESNFYEDERNFYSGSFTKPRSFVKPICDLFIAVFSLNRSNSGWLRGRAIIVVLQQLLGSTIEKYIKDMIGRLQSEASVYELIVAVKNMLWVDDVFFKSSNATQHPLRTESMILKSKREASLLLDRLMVETCGRVVGVRSAKYSSLILHAMLQNEYLNAGLILEILDVIIDELF
ncbi:HGR073Wp [Eremothecium sinecaudum]|uniref:HGR073Wp n=1 Tax=Eremothecium sinecaudum TaxID=45286 RepID=A0A109UY85_9SACH|nr:HGR073Wp [Eremothecium sinecaudum]AMD22412.1 HGR073Wp [Eremothecium sinecaudum]